MANEPIEEQDYVGGVTVVDIGDLRVARGMTRRPVGACRHGRMVYDQKERRVWCKDCESDVDSFDAFKALVEYYAGALERLERERKQVEEAKAFSVRSRAAKAMDEAWRSRTMVPACPHCRNGLLPEHFANGGCSMVGREFAEAQFKRNRKPGGSTHG